MVWFKRRAAAESLLQVVIVSSLVTLVGRTPLARAEQNPPTNPAAPPPAQQIPQKPSPPSGGEEGQALQQAVEAASGNPQALIKNLQNFLAQFPQSSRREQVLRAILKEALQSNDPSAAVASAEKLLELSPRDPALLSTLVDLLGGQNGAASREKAIQYGTRLIERAEKLASEPKPPDLPAERWQQAQVMLRAAAYLSRGKVYADSGESEKALADYENSFRAYPSAQAAERLGDVAARMGKVDRAIDEYATAFAFPEKNPDPARRDHLRRKLGSVYVAKYHSEKGLGDLVLSRYDELIETLKSRSAPQDAPNAGVRDPFDYVLVRPDGPALRLADYRGKVVVMDFWATWCAPCRVEGRLFERVVDNFRQEAGVAFLAVNVDEERGSVPRFIKEEGWTVPVVYGQGLDHLLGVRALPTLVIFDRAGRVVFRQEGLEPGTFVQTLDRRVAEALRTPTAAGTP